VLGDKWKALSEKQREPYEKKAAADKKRYEDEKAKYNVSDFPIPLVHCRSDNSARPATMMMTTSKQVARVSTLCGFLLFTH
jgi:hypothetical protein